MNSLATFAVRRAASRTIGQQVRPLTGSTIGVDVDHYNSGWEKVGDIGEFTKAGKFQIQTFNKISEKVRRSCRNRIRSYRMYRIVL